MPAQRTRAGAGGRAMLAAAALLLLSLPMLAPRLRAERTGAGARSQDETARELRNSSAIAQILGQFRTDLGDLLFIKTEAYLDNGVLYQPHIDMAKMQSTGETADRAPDAPAGVAQGQLHSHDDGTTCAADHTDATATTSVHEHEHEHHLVPTIIPTALDDFRGFIGAMQRQVKPWRDPSEPHQHTNGMELLPWYRLATLGDPKNVRSYMIGAWWLKSMRKPSQLAEAEKFVDEGIHNNPESFQLNLMKGYILHQRGEEEPALKAFMQAADLALKQRTPRGVDDGKWSNYMEDDSNAACTMSVLLTRDLRGTRAALDLADSYLARGENLGRIESTRRLLADRLKAEEGTQP